MMEFVTRGELHKYLDSNEWKSKQKRIFDPVFFLIEYDGEIQPYTFLPYFEHYIEFKCKLSKTYYTEEEFQDYVRYFCDDETFEEELNKKKKAYRNGWMSEIVMELMPLYLVGRMKLIEIFNESECLEWLLDHETKNGN